MRYLETVAVLTLVRTSVYIGRIYTHEDPSRLYLPWTSLTAAVGSLSGEDVKALAAAEGVEAWQYQQALTILADGLNQQDQQLAQVCQNLLDLCLTNLLYPEFGQVLLKYTGAMVNLKLAFGLEGMDMPTYGAYWSVGCAVKRLFPLNMEEYPFFYQNIQADNRMLAYLYGEKKVPERIKDFVTSYDGMGKVQELFINQPLLDTVKEMMGVHQMDVLQLSGERGSGRKLLVQHICQEGEIELLILDLDRLARRLWGPEERVSILNNEKLNELLFLLKRECLFREKMILCISNVEEEGLNRMGLTAEDFSEVFLEPFRRMGVAVCVTTSIDFPISCYYEGSCTKLEISECTAQQRLELWEGYRKEYGISAEVLNSAHYANKYRLTPGEIQKVVAQLADYAAGGMAIQDNTISSICNDIIPPPSSGKLQKIRSGLTMDDLILPEKEKQTLLTLCSNIWCSNTVYDVWGLGRKFPYGRGVTALFTGAPGTGKTMAAYAIANTLNIPLFKADLSQIADKYIGESEKHLEEIFRTTEKSNMVLFFDEADSLFGKRSEVNDSKDKYANNEVAYILQRLEQYEGIVLLATNYQNNIDPAFIRRMRYVVNFPLPDEASRKKIWQSYLISDMPQEDIDVDFLAENFTLTGSNIKSIVLSAAFLAASHQDKLNMRWVVEALQSECAKTGKKILPCDLGPYEYLLGMGSNGGEYR